MAEFDCALCHDLLFQPCVPPCGHAFCRECLRKVLQPCISGSRRCPLCRRVLHAAGRSDLAVCTPFAQLLEVRFPEAYARRRAETSNASEAALPEGGSGDAGDDRTEELGLIVLDAALPRQRLRLNVFEPRYRALMAHALEGGRRFGMVGFDAFGDRLDHGVEMLIEECGQQSDGRFHVQAVGVRAFSITEATVQEDGYQLARVEWVDLDGGVTPREEDVLSARSLAPLLVRWEEIVSRVVPGHLAAVRAELGPAPPAERPADFAMWAAALINPLPPLGVAPEIRPATLTAADAAERLGVVHSAVRVSMEHLSAVASSPLRRFMRRLTTLPPAVYLLLFASVALARLR